METKNENESTNWLTGEIKVIITELFFKYKCVALYYTLTEVIALINNPNCAVRFRAKAIRDELQNNFGLMPRMGRYSQPREEEFVDFGAKYSKIARCYEFRIQDFLTEDEITCELNEYIDYTQLPVSRDINQNTPHPFPHKAKCLPMVKALAMVFQDQIAECIENDEPLPDRIMEEVATIVMEDGQRVTAFVVIDTNWGNRDPLDPLPEVNLEDTAS
jgi:hypothetical protein